MARHKRQNQQLFDLQNGSCALCEQPIPAGPNQMCYYEPKNVVVCRTCNTILHNYVRLKGPGGVTISGVESFLGREPQAKAKAKRKVKELNFEQLNTVQRIVNGQASITLIDWCQRAKIAEADALEQLANS